MRWLFPLFLLLIPVAHAGYDEGVAAFDRGDFATAHREFLSLAEGGNPDAQYAIALIAMKQQPPDYAVAVPWLEQGARGGNADAQYILGLLYQQGVGVAPSERLAEHWFQQAAAEGHPDATSIVVQRSVRQNAIESDAQSQRSTRQSSAPGSSNTDRRESSDEDTSISWFWYLAIGFLLLYFLGKGKRRKTKRRKSTAARDDDDYDEDWDDEPSGPEAWKANEKWLKERWTRAKTEQKYGESVTVPDWYFDQVTDRQIAFIKERGVPVRAKGLNKGQASDVIGLFMEPEEENEKLLRFFKVPMRGMNQSKARDVAAQILANGDNARLWESRPATAWQKEFYRTFDMPISRGLTERDAQKAIRKKTGDLAKSDEVRLREWEEYEDIYEQLFDPGSREDYEVKKVSIPAMREAVVSLLEEGHTMEHLASELDLVVDRLKQKNPKLHHEYY